MKDGFNILLAVASLALAALACQAVTSSPDTSVVSTDVVIENTLAADNTEAPLPTQTEAPTGNSDVLFDDDFASGSRTKWGTGTDADSSVEYVDDSLNIKLFKKNYIVWTSPNDTEYENIHMEVTALNNGSDSSTAFGLMCDQQSFITDFALLFCDHPRRRVCNRQSCTGAGRCDSYQQRRMGKIGSDREERFLVSHWGRLRQRHINFVCGWSASGFRLLI